MENKVTPDYLGTVGPIKTIPTAEPREISIPVQIGTNSPSKTLCLYLALKHKI